MPKKFGGNTKSMEAREKVQAKKNADRARKEKEEEDKLWVDDDKHVNKKLDRKNDKELKRLEELERKRQNKLLAEEEMNSLPSKATKKPPNNRVTQAEIAARIDAQMKKVDATLGNKKDKVVEQDLLCSNLNRMGVNESSARTVDDAINILNDESDSCDKHPEKRVKAAFNAYKQKMLPILKAENPSLKLSQLNERIFKDFQTSPENPKNQANAC